MADFVADASMPADDRLAHYQQAASTAFAPLRIRPANLDRFAGHIRHEQAGGLVVADIRSAPVTVARTAKLITSGDNEIYKVALHVSGTATISQDGRQHRLRPGDLVIYDTTRPYTLDFREDYRTVVIACPRDRLAAHANALSRTTAVPIGTNSGVRRLVAGFFNGLAGELDSTVPEGGAYLADSLLDMVVMAFLGPERRNDCARSALIDRVIAHCEANLSDPCLSVHTVARAHGISTRYLHKLFATRDQPLAAWIRSRRLDRIRRDLENPGLANRTVAAIAARWGMPDPAHASRSFRAAYGISPSEYRRHALTARDALG
ncbi:helix-turn-helix domain-containing protein [Gandjariella thermophila]|uniref:AraC family transcriptional regulator n=1 Tax=Gandjariella thermophila TaxID=1931992 RepID=A0A4D4JAS6_9PSEU|nr:helix-turn-helix domain-containing protein [Gandjariella thermophila]GDY32664.1 AraC family transcriptional regulator [Gandjariella thermophila]